MISWLGYPSTKYTNAKNVNLSLIGYCIILAISGYYVYSSDTDIDLDGLDLIY